MRLRPTLISVLAGLPVTLLGQGAVPPLQVGAIPQVPGLNAGAVPGLLVVRAHMVHLPGSPPSVFYCALGVQNLPAALGGAGNTDILCGSYDVLTDTFTPNMDAAAMNTAGHEYNMTLHHSGMLATFDRPSAAPLSPPVLVSRSAIGGPWQLVGPIGGLPCCGGGSYTPALADYHGQTHLLYSSPVTGEIVMAPIDLTTAQLVGVPFPIVFPAPLTYNTSPIPVTDPNGEIIGVSHGVVSGGVIDVDHFLSLDLDPSTPAVLVRDTPTWTTPCGFVGGRFFGHEYDVQSPLPSAIFSIDAFWCTGGRAPVGGTMSVRMFSPPTSASVAYFSLLGASTAYLPIGLPFPPAQGLLGIGSAGMWASVLQPHNNASGEAVVSFPIPNLGVLFGTRLPVQSATFDAVSGVVFLGNTAALVIE